ncbi:MAG: DegT/DnrJ/EryC1/StrS family aminotransferase [Chloroflexi bacterium]|nr:DegT/DnrJ/EryC1/StrS family aminotransferase [Chloroflexota bacterium]
MTSSDSPVRDSFLVFGSPAIEEAEIQEVVATLRSGWLSTGPKTHLFEEEFRRYIGCHHALALNSCTAGLHLALDAIGVGEGDEVITTPVTFAATANVIVHHRAHPVFVDIRRDTMNIDPEQIEAKITPRTRAILPVHLAGRPCQMDAIMDIARRHNLFVVEDAAHAVEAEYQGQKVGTIGHITAFSFYVTKNVCTGEGGMVTTENDDWAEEMRLRSLHGISKDAWKRYSAEGYQPYETIYPGYKFNMMDIQASLGIHQLARVEENHRVRERWWHRYNEAFSEMPELITPLEEEGIRHSRHLYTILIRPERLQIDRDQFVEALKEENIGTGIHFTTLHLHAYYRQTFGFRRGDFPNAEFVSDRTISLPLSAKLTERDVDDVVAAVRKVSDRYRR